MKPYVRYVVIFGLAFCILPLSAYSQMTADLVRNKQVNEIANAIFSYTCVAKACDDANIYSELRSRLVKFLEFSHKRGSLTSDGERLYSDTSRMVDAGAALYKAKPYISCGEYRRYVPLLKSTIDGLLAANK